MEKEQLYQKIEDYIQDKLDKDQKASFESEMNADEELRKMLKLHQIIHEDLSQDVNALRVKLKEIDLGTKIIDKKETKKRSPLRILGPLTAIAAALLIGIIFLPDLLNPSLSSSQAYDKYYQPYPMALNQRSDNGNVENNLLNEAIAAYSNGRYEEASKLFGQLFDQNGDTTYKIYQAHALLANNEATMAIDVYDEVLNSNDSRFHQQASWYKGLALLSSGNTVSAKEVFQNFSPDHYKYMEAQKILKNLNN